MTRRSIDRLLAVAAGMLLALMTDYNSLLAKHTGPVFGAWVAHGLGAVAALALVVLSTRFLGRRPGPAARRRSGRAPFWSYLGGFPGALTVVLAAITVNGGLSLSGSIAFMLVGQMVFGMLCDRFALFGTPRRRVSGTDLLSVSCVLVGSSLVIFGGA